MSKSSLYMCVVPTLCCNGSARQKKDSISFAYGSASVTNVHQELSRPKFKQATQKHTSFEELEIVPLHFICIPAVFIGHSHFSKQNLIHFLTLFLLFTVLSWVWIIIYIVRDVFWSQTLIWNFYLPIPEKSIKYEVYNEMKSDILCCGCVCLSIQL